MAYPSGEQFVLEYGPYHAVITEVGATLRRFDAHGKAVVWGFDETEISGASRGQVLAPWPNRLDNGAYRFDNVGAKAPLDEPERRCAIHGLMRWLAFTPLERHPSRVRLSGRLAAQPAYPFSLCLEVEYRLHDEGLTVTPRASNEGERPAPFGIGFHPYLAGGSAGLDRARLDLSTKRHLLLDDRGLPIGDEPIDALPDGGNLGGAHLDDCYSDLASDEDARWHARFWPDAAQSGHVELWADEAYRYAMCFTADTLVGADRRRAMAIEPMTCPPNALATGTDLIVLTPDVPFVASWGLKVSDHDR